MKTIQTLRSDINSLVQKQQVISSMISNTLDLEYKELKNQSLDIGRRARGPLATCGDVQDYERVNAKLGQMEQALKRQGNAVESFNEDVQNIVNRLWDCYIGLFQTTAEKVNDYEYDDFCHIFQFYRHFIEEHERQPFFRSCQFFSLAYLEGFFAENTSKTNVHTNAYHCQIKNTSLDTSRFLTQTVGINEVLFATLHDNPKALVRTLKGLGSMTTLSMKDTIDSNNLIFFAIANKALKAVDKLLSLGASVSKKVDMQATDNKLYRHTALSLALSICPILPRGDARKLIHSLLEADANYNQKLQVSWVEMRGYMGANAVTIEKRYRLFDFDQTGLLEECVSERKKQYHKQATSTPTNSKSKSVTPCRFFKPGQPASCRNGSDCDFSHDQTKEQPITIKSKKTAACHFFKQDIPNSCRKGDACEFYHQQHKTK